MKIANEDTLRSVGAACALLAASSGFINDAKQKEFKKFIIKSGIKDHKKILKSYYGHLENLNRRGFFYFQKHALSSVEEVRSFIFSSVEFIEVCINIVTESRELDFFEKDILNQICETLRLEKCKF